MEEERERAKQHIHNIYRSTRKGMLEETPKWKLRFDLCLDAFLPTEMGYACHFVSIIEHYNLHTTEKVLNSPVLIVVALYIYAGLQNINILSPVN